MRKFLLTTLFVLPFTAHAQINSAVAQPSAIASKNIFDSRTAAQIQQEADVLTTEAKKSPVGLANVTFEKYRNSLTMLGVRTSTGGGELHQHVSDYFIVIDGEAREMVGGTMEGGKETAPGEIRGTRVVGGAEHVMHKGDVIHIAAGIPHQTIVAPGKTFTYFVIKVQE
jgi:mannose-6-phosphate isomerase-like protein (cupin superfamily)